ncbi:MAG: hypothetical protein ACFFBH_08330 [Promethearchaeota archaeon]
MKKLITICPVCKMHIYGKDINILNLSNIKADSWPLNYIYYHTYNDYPLHSLTLYLDSHFSVRGYEVSDNLLENR